MNRILPGFIPIAFLWRLDATTDVGLYEELPPRVVQLRDDPPDSEMLPQIYLLHGRV